MQIKLFIFTAKILIAGTNVKNHYIVTEDITQVLDLADPSKTCEPLDKLEYDLHIGAAYGLLDNAYPVFCGGKFGGKIFYVKIIPPSY